MIDTEKINLFDEIVNCGILEEDSVVNFGAGDSNGEFLETLLQYNGFFEKERIKAIEPDSKKIKNLTKKFTNQEIEFFETSLQSYLDSEPSFSDWIVITGVFDKHLYGEHQHDYVESVLENSIRIANKGVIFSIRKTLSSEFRYSIILLFNSFIEKYDKVTIKKIDNDNFIFCIFNK